MTSTYQFRISSVAGYVQAGLRSLLVPVIYVSLVFLLLSPETLNHYSNYFYFFGGALWTIAFVSTLSKAGVQVVCRMEEEGLSFFSGRSRSTKEDYNLSWSNLESYSISRNAGGMMLIMKLRNSAKDKNISIPLINNDREQVKLFLNDFQKYASQYATVKLFQEKSTARQKLFYQTKFARIIGYIFIAYLMVILFIKISGLDNQKLSWSNILSTGFFAAVYLVFVFWPGSNRSGR